MDAGLPAAVCVVRVGPLPTGRLLRQGYAAGACVCVCLSLSVCVSVSLHMFVCAHMFVCSCVCVCVRMCVCVRGCMLLLRARGRRCL